MNTIFKGAGVALVTPFRDDYKVDFSSLEKLIEFQISNGTNAIITCGTTGEPSTMTTEEEREVIKFVIKKVNGRVPVIVGAGSNDTQTALDNCRFCKDAGADGLLIVSPYYNKCTQKGLVKYYTMLADETDLPIIVYNIKGRTGINIDVDTMKEIAKHPNIVGLKEASGDMNQIMAMLHTLKDQIAIYSGDDSLTLPMVALGASGVISVASNIVPKEMCQLCELTREGKLSDAVALNDKLTPLFKDLFIEVNPIPVKYAMNKLGMNAGKLRLPLTELEDAHKSVLDKVLKDFFG